MIHIRSITCVIAKNARRVFLFIFMPVSKEPVFFVRRI